MARTTILHRPDSVSRTAVGPTGASRQELCFAIPCLAPGQSRLRARPDHVFEPLATGGQTSILGVFREKATAEVVEQLATAFSQR